MLRDSADAFQHPKELTTTPQGLRNGRRDGLRIISKLKAKLRDAWKK
jgi:hypothetical protein